MSRALATPSSQRRSSSRGAACTSEGACGGASTSRSSPAPPGPPPRACRRTAVAARTRLRPSTPSPGIFATGSRCTSRRLPRRIRTTATGTRARPCRPSGWPGPPRSSSRRPAARRRLRGPRWPDGVLRLDEVTPATRSRPARRTLPAAAARPRGVIEGAAPADAGRCSSWSGATRSSVSLGSERLPAGALVVCGRLTVRGDFHLEGALHAGSLETRSPVSITVRARTGATGCSRGRCGRS